MSEPKRGGLNQLLFSRSGLALVGFLAVAGYFLWSEHEAHIMALVPYLPWLLLLACPLLHLFMHHGHGSHGKETNGGKDASSAEQQHRDNGGTRHE